MSKISVIIPVYNSADYLEKCLDSILNQDLKDIEVICTDDGSSDNSLDIIESYAKKDERVMSIWTASPLGANSRPKDVVDINLEKIDDRLFMINTKELETGHYAIYYQEELKTLMEFYDFDLVE